MYYLLNENNELLARMSGQLAALNYRNFLLSFNIKRVVKIVYHEIGEAPSYKLAA